VYAARANLNGVTEFQDAKSIFLKSFVSVKNRPIQQPLYKRVASKKK